MHICIRELNEKKRRIVNRGLGKDLLCFFTDQNKEWAKKNAKDPLTSDICLLFTVSFFAFKNLCFESEIGNREKEKKTHKTR